MTIIIKPNKNIILLYSLLIYMYNKKLLSTTDLLKNNLYIRKEIETHFNQFDLNINYKLKQHYSKSVAFVLSLDNNLNIKKINNISKEMEIEINKGKEILLLIKKFKQETDFDLFYKNKILPFLKEKCNLLNKVLIKSNLEYLLKNAWEIDFNFNLNIVINPLEGDFCGIGPSIGKNSYQIIGPPFDKNIIFLLSHEASHPYAKEYKRNSLELIKSKNYFFNKIKKQKNWPKDYSSWVTCFEEHLVRTVDIICLNYYLETNLNIKKISVDVLLKKQKYKGFLYIDLFYDVISKHKKNNTFKKSNLVIKDILDRIEKEHF